jgi:two-component system phosphate regulon sensor histidine kinase PhoR
MTSRRRPIPNRMETLASIGLDALPVAAVVLDPDGRVAGTNERMRALFAARECGLEGTCAAELFPAEDGVLERLAGAARAGAAVRLESRRRNAVPFTVDAEVSAFEGGELLCVLREVRDGRLIEASRVYLDQAFERAPIGMALFNTDGQYVRVNDELCRMLGRDEKELLGRRDQELTHPDDRQSDLDAAWRILRGEISIWQTEKRFLAPDGAVVWAIANMSFIRDDAGRPLFWLGQFQDITGRKRQEEQLRKERDFSASLIRSMQDGVYVMSVEGEVLEVNDRLCALTGYARHELIGGRPPFPFWPEEERPALEAKLRETLRGTVGAERDVVISRRDGASLPVITSMAPLRDGDRVTAWVATVKDVSERRRLELMRNEFAALASHELRTPLTSVVGYLEAVTEGEAGPLAPEQARLLAVAERNAKHLARLVEDVLEVTRADAGQLRIELRPVDLAALAAECVEASRPSAEAGALTLELDAPAVVTVPGDRRRLLQVVDNLVANAIKFTPEGGRVAVRVRAEDGQAVIEVCDTGIGMTPAEQERLFERFYRAEGATARQIRGTGLGLAITREIVLAHGGAIECRSAAGEGSTFRVTLPASA